MNSLQQWKQLELYSECPSQRASRDTSSEEFIASRLSESPTGQIRLMESILERNNMRCAIKRVIKNGGAPGVDGMSVRKFKWLVELFRDNRALQPFTLFGPLDQTTASGACLEAVQEPKNPCAGTPGTGIARDYTRTTGCSRKGPWRMSKGKWVHIALPDAYFTSLELLFPWT